MGHWAGKVQSWCGEGWDWGSEQQLQNYTAKQQILVCVGILLEMFVLFTGNCFVVATEEEEEGFMSKERISANSLTLSLARCLRGERNPKTQSIVAMVFKTGESQILRA